MFWVGLLPVSWKKNEEEAEMIRYFDLALYQTRGSRTKKKRRWLNILIWPCTRLVEAERRRNSSQSVPYLPLCVYLNRSSTLSITQLFRAFRNKRKRKEHIFIRRSCCFLFGIKSLNSRWNVLMKVLYIKLYKTVILILFGFFF